MTATNIPKSIGRYQIECEIGRGAMGVVYKATDPNIGRVVALKTMRLDVNGDDEEEFLRRFKHEAKLAGVMSHPNIVTVHDAGEDTGVFFMAMEFLEGVTLHSVLKEKRVMPLQRVVEIARHVAAGLDYAHAHGVIHRDVKPANIMCATGGHIKIMDFGIAKSGAGMTTAGQVLGTPTYMSPEQVRGKLLDGRSDLFSFGVILYEMVTGEKPFTGQNVTTIIYKIMNEDPIPPRDLDAAVHPGVSAVILKALAKNPNQRYQNGAELVRELEDYKAAGEDAESTKMIAAVAVASNGGVGQNPETSSATVTAYETPSATDITEHVRSEPQTTTKMAGSTGGPGLESTGIQQPADADAVLQSIGSTVMVGDHVKPDEDPVGKGGAKLPAKKIGIAAVTVLLLATIVVGRQLKSNRAAERSAITSSAATLPITTPAPIAVTTTEANAKPSAAKGSAAPTSSKAKVGNTAAKPIINSPKIVSAVINSTPPGAAITLDKKETGKVTPATLKVVSGAHEIMLHKDTYRDASTSATLKEGEVFRFTPILEPQKSGGGGNPFHAIKGIFGGGRVPAGKGMVHIKTRPAGAEIVYKGSTIEQHTPAKFPLDPGTYHVRIRLDGYKPEQRDFTVVQGKTIDVNVELQPK